MPRDLGAGTPITTEGGEHERLRGCIRAALLPTVNDGADVLRNRNGIPAVLGFHLPGIHDGKHYDEFSVFPEKPQSIMARYTSFERSKATVSSNTYPLLDENGASHMLIINHGHSPAAEKRRSNFVALGKDAIGVNEIEVTICPAKYAVVE